MTSAAETFPPQSIHAWRANAGEDLAVELYDKEVRGERAAQDLHEAQQSLEDARQEHERAAVEAWSRRLNRLSRGIEAACGLLLLLVIVAAIHNR